MKKQFSRNPAYVKSICIPSTVLILALVGAPTVAADTEASVTVDVPVKTHSSTRPQVPPGHTLRETVLCYVESRGASIYSARRNALPPRNPIQVVDGGVKMADGTCVEVDASGQLKIVPGQCVWLSSTDTCNE